MSVSSTVLRAALAAVLCGPGAGGIALAASADPVVIEFRDGVVTPQAIELSAGTETTLVLRNAGTSAAEFESKRLKQERAIGPNAEITVTLPPLPAGSYEFVEEFHEDQASARGVITVK